MSILIIAAAFILTGILVGLISTATAPVGYEDGSGFHFGDENGRSVPRRRNATGHRRPTAARLHPKHA